MNKNNIVCGIHYEALHQNKIYNSNPVKCELSTILSKQTASIPFHENLNNKELIYIVNQIKKYE